MLTVQSQAISLQNPQSIRAYFEKIRELSLSGEAYPVDFDEVWPLAYTQKGDAIRALRKTFEENLDYQTFSRNAKRAIGATVTHCYRLSVSCVEYLIARRVRQVFEIYRAVFHQVVGVVAHVPQSGLIALVQRQSDQLTKLERKLDLMKRENIKQFRLRKSHFYLNARLRREGRAALAQERERDELFELFARYVKLHSFQSGETILESVLRVLCDKFNLDLRGYVRHTGEHYFELAIRMGKGYCVAAAIKSHLTKSGELK